MRIAVLDAATVGTDLDLAPLKEFGDVRIFDHTAPDEVYENLGDADVAIINKVKMNETTIGKNKNLKLICLFATGYDNVDTAYCASRGIAVCNVVGYSTQCVAQVTVAMVLSLVTHLPAYTEHVASGKYSSGNTANCLAPVYHEIAGMTWGIAGYGSIGKAVADVARAFGCRVIAFKRTPAEDVETVDIDTLCRESDIITVHLPLNDSTRGIFGKKQISEMKPGAVFVNVARGAVADEYALTEAIRQNRLGGLGVDVYSSEPFGEEHPFYSVKDHENVCFTPHMAWGAQETRKRCLDEICENIRVFASGGRRCRVES